MKKEISLKYIYLLLSVISCIILFANSKVQNVDPSNFGEYYYSKFLRVNYNMITGSLFMVVGFLFGFLYKVKPWVVGLSMISIFLLATAYEMIVFRSSHNLLPFELIIYLIFSLPSIFGAQVGLYLKRKIQRH